MAQRATTKKIELSLRTRAMRYLVRREHSRAELHKKLIPKASPEDNIDGLLDDLVARGWLSDSRMVEHIVHIRRNRFGVQRITHELRQKGIAEHLISEVLPQMQNSELEAARDIWSRRFGIHPENIKEKAKQARFLQSRGFMLDVISKVLRGGEDGE